MKHIAKTGEEEVIEVRINRFDHPNTFNALVESMMKNANCDRESAERYYSTTPIPLELYVNKKHNALWGVDSEEVGNTDCIYDPIDDHELTYIPTEDD